MTWFLFFLLTFATARITWLITEDHLPLVARPRQWVQTRFGDESNLAYLSSCWFCVSVYVAAGVAAFAIWALHSHLPNIVDWEFFLLLWPALSFAAVGIMGAIDWLTSAPDHDD